MNHLKLKRVLSWPDTHAPFQDNAAIEVALKVAKDFKPHVLIILGDFFDFYSVSRYEKNPLKDYKVLYDEITEARKTLDYVIGEVGAKEVVFLGGNHELRLEKYIATNAPKLGGLFREKEILGIPDRILYIPYGPEGHYKIGKLIFTHGSRTGENPSASMVKKYRSSVLFGHCHRLQEYHITNIHGTDFVGLSPGWLGSQRKAGEYIHDVSDWSKGIALTWHKPGGDFYHQLVHIKEPSYSCIYNGVLYQRW